MATGDVSQLETRRSAGPANLNQLVASHIRHAIFSGSLRPRDKIDQDAIASHLGISKLPVREALIVLEQEGIVENMPRRGAYVAALTPDDILDHYRLIGLASGLAAHRAATILSDEQLERLGGLLRQLDRERDPARQEELNASFHRVINLAGGSARLRSALRLLNQTMPQHFFEFASGWARQANREHRRVLKALLARDPEAADEAMVEHITSGGRFALRMLEGSGFWR